LNNVRYEIVGVAASSFLGDWTGRPTDVWLPLSTLPVLTADTSFFSDRWGDGPRRLRVVGRLRPGVAVAAAEARTNLVFQQLVSAKATAIGEQAPSIKRERGQQVALISAATGYAPERDSHRRPVTIVATMVTLLFIVACVNFANLLLARSKDRSHELNVRLALGASRWRIVRQTIAECSVLSAAAAMLGVFLSGWGAAAALNAVALTGQRLAPDVEIDFRVLAFAAMCMGVVLVFGVMTSLWAIRKRDRTPMLRSGATERRRHIFDAGQVLLVGQMTLCAMILVASVLLLRTVMNLRTQDLGFDRNVLLISLSPRDLGGPSLAAVPLLSELQERIRALPQVEGVGASGATLLAPGNYWTDTAARLTTETGSPTSDLHWTFASVGDGFFGAMGATVRAGREFDAADVAGPNNVAIINQTMAAFLFADRDPIGRLIGIDGQPANLRVIGVVSDAKQRSPRDRGLGMVYLPLREIRNSVTVAVRTALDADSQVTAMVVEQLRTIRPDLTQTVVPSLNDVFEEAIARERVLARAAAFFGLLVLLIACVGLHAIMSHRVKRRTHEIGVRLAMGATKQRVMILVLRETIARVLVGLAVGLPLGSLLGHQLRAQLFDISAQDPATLVAVALILLLVTSVATLRTARAASRIEPVALLRAASL
jgi:predicted permease